jgi:hypothetical protein
MFSYFVVLIKQLMLLINDITRCVFIIKNLVFKSVSYTVILALFKVIIARDFEKFKR